ncbi:MAG: hypothetical protein UV28_C0029G0017 [Candidatus Collierbacteria bacterium GW2011_GWE2_42_48]|nr:MAG: hypothetical protein UV28_C0029G0017 [Candidatus Collierbacteria bacterium GW2011_GWE2_42_48]
MENRVFVSNRYKFFPDLHTKLKQQRCDLANKDDIRLEYNQYHNLYPEKYALLGPPIVIQHKNIFGKTVTSHPKSRVLCGVETKFKAVTLIAQEIYAPLLPSTAIHVIVDLDYEIWEYLL